MATSTETKGTKTAGARVSVVAVAFKSFDVLPAMAATLPEGTQLICVDNGPPDGLEAWAQANGHIFIPAGKNLGFGTACNLGAARSTREFVFFLNPDATLRPGAVDLLVAALDRRPDASASGPAFFAGSGKMFSVRPSIILPRGLFARRKSRPTVETQVPSLSGAGLMVRRSAFEKIGGFDPEIFLYFEDDDVTLRLDRDAGPLLYVPEARVDHASGGSTEASPALSAFKGYHYIRSYSPVMKKFGRSAPMARTIWSVLRRFLSMRMLKSVDRRHDAFGRLRGLRSLLGAKLGPPPL
ncbi:MAG: glycosyltransferase family 2 protein [Pseudomonadota bacterium]|nr:glycosyltransferase family 2 protein [Pseudomonadota bacterium]